MVGGLRKMVSLRRVQTLKQCMYIKISSSEKIFRIFKSVIPAWPESFCALFIRVFNSYEEDRHEIV